MAEPLSRERRAELERRAWSLRLRFRTQEQIAAELGVDQSTVSRMLARVEARALKALARRVERLKARQTGQLEHIAGEAMAQWERSKLDAETRKTVEDTGSPADGDDGPAMPRTRTETTVKGQAGDPALLAQARGALADVRAIWGLDAPERVESSTSVKLYDVANPPESL